MNIFEAVHIRKAFAAIAIVFMSLSTVALAATEPIPGIDVVVRKKPGGKAIIVKTDKNGRFSIAGLAPGAYDLTWSRPGVMDAISTTRAAINTTRSNIKHPSIGIASRVSRGAQQVTLTIQASTDASGHVIGGSTADSHQSIVITAAKGKLAERSFR